MRARSSLHFLVPLCASVVFVAASYFGFFNAVNGRVYDMFLGAKPEVPQNKSLLLIDIDDQSISKVGVWPWSRSVVADGLITLGEFGAKYAVFDIEYVNQSPLGVNGSYLNQRIPAEFDRSFGSLAQNITGLFDALQSGSISIQDAQDYVQQLVGITADTKQQLLKDVQAIARDNDIYLGQAAWFFRKTYLTVNVANQSEEMSPTYEKWVLDNVALRNAVEKQPYGHVVRGITPAIEPILTRAAGAGFPKVIVDPDGVRRRVDLAIQYRNRFFGQLIFRPLLDYLGNPEVDLYRHSIVLKNAKLPGEPARDVAIPLAQDGTFLINWPKTDYSHSFRHMSYYQLVLSQNQEGALLTLLRAMAAANYLSFYPGGKGFFAPYDQASQIEQSMLAGGDPDQISRYRELRARFFDGAGQFLSSDAEKRILSQIDAALASPRITPSQESSFTAIRGDVEAKFSQARSVYSALTESRKILAGYLGGSFCIVGNTATSSTDLGVNPFFEQYPNVGTHASVANTILSGRYITSLPEWWTMALIALLCFAVYFSIRTLEPAPSLIVGFGILIVFVGGTVLLFMFTRIYLSILSPAIALFLTFLLLTVLKFLATAQEKSYIRNAFGRYLSGDVINELLADPDKLKLGGEKKYLTAFFTDIRGFSTISENMDPSDLVKLLNEYLTHMSDIILAQRGTIDKFEGDAIISFFGAPIEYPDHAFHACRAALEMKRAETELNERFLRDKMSPSPLVTRIGINTGEMVVGNMGTANKMDYTMMGNCVNLASRLEGVNKQYGTWILCSETTQAACSDGLLFRRLDRVRVVGIQKSVRLYELVAEKSSSPSAEGSARAEELIASFHIGLDQFEAKRWAEAKRSFEAVLRIDANDGPAATYVKRCDEYLKTPPPADWDGVFNLSMK